HLVQKRGMKARIVTNGQRPFEKFMDVFESPELPHICFSIDGSCSAVNDTIRGKGTFNNLLRSLSIAHEKGYEISGIISLSRLNAHDCEALLELCEQLRFQYVNIHHVTNRGYATADSVLTIDEWLAVVERLIKKSQTIDLDVRLEKTFVTGTSFVGGCAVRE